MAYAGLKRAAAALIFLCSSAAPQQVSKVEFEVVSVKPASPAAVGRTARNSKSRWEGRNLRLKELVMSAYRLSWNRIEGGPGWIESAGWDIDAKIPEVAGPAQFPQMMQAMLAERFQLAVHRETRTLPVYFLQVARSGPKLKESTSDVASMSAGPRMIKYSKGSMGDLADQLTSYLQKQVSDRTGLTGRYEINLAFAPVDLDPSLEAAANETLPSIFRALEEQLGLKLESGKGPVEVLVIDRAEKPSEN